jgi:lysophospholipase L1-like esterase
VQPRLRPRLPLTALAAAAAAWTAFTIGTAPPAQGAAPAIAKGSSPVVTWAASADRVGAAVPDRTYRLVVHTSAGGSGLRIRLSNAFGEQPVVFGRAFVGVRRSGAALAAHSNRPLSFGGSTSVTLRPGGIVSSDPLPGRVPPQSDLAVSLYVRSAGGTATGHGMAMQTSYISPGDHAAEEGAAAFAHQTGSWFYLDALVVGARRGTGAVAALGDSITDGWQSTSDRNNRWPDYLARRLAADRGSGLEGVANEGISGNRVLADGAGQSALHRLDRDVLSQEGLRTVILFEGVNDIKGGSGVTAAEMIAGYRQIITRAHAAGVCVVGATILPFKGWPEWDEEGETARQGINTFIRASGEFDATVDFDRELRSPYDPARLFPPFDGGDHLHPNDKGMQAMADAVDLAGLRCARED